MATQTQTTAATGRRGLPGLSCPSCGAKDVLAVRVAVASLLCEDCTEVLTLQEVRVLAASWAALVEWMEHLPPAAAE